MGGNMTQTKKAKKTHIKTTSKIKKLPVKSMGKHVGRILAYVLKIILLTGKTLTKNMKKSKKHALFFGALIGVILLVGLRTCVMGYRSSEPESLCTQTFAHKLHIAKSSFFKRLDLCPFIPTKRGPAQLYIGTVKTKEGAKLDYACIIIGKEVITDFERAPAFFYINSIHDKMTKEAKDLLCRDIQTLFGEHITQNCGD